jgi:hypothetical protein
MSVNNYWAITCLTLLSAMVAIGGEPGAMDPRVLLRELQRNDAQAVVKKLNKAQWTFALKSIETGEAPWLDVAVSLHRLSDAGESEMLSLAVGAALAKNPLGVLRTTIGEMSVESVCGYPDMSDHRTDSQEKVVAYLDARIQAVDRVGASEVTGQREKCLETLQTTWREARSPNGPFGRPR